MNREMVDKWCERGILALVLAILVFGPLATGAVRTLEFLVLQGLTIGVLLLWGLRLWASARPQVLWTPLCWAVAAFVVYAIIRYFTADIEYVARRELIRVLVYASLFFVILNNLYRQESIQIISYTLIGLATAISGYAIYQYFTGSPYVWHFLKPALYAKRAGGTYICPNHLAGFLEMLLPLALSYMVVTRGKAVMRVLVGYAAIAMLAGVGATISRGGWISCAAGLLFLIIILLAQRSYRLTGLVLLTGLLATGALVWTKMDPAERRFVYIPTTPWETFSDAAVRLDLWEPAVRMWQDHPWFGVGPGHYDYQFRSYRPQTMQARPEFAHNEYLNLLADWGTIGAVIMGAALVALCAGVVKTWRHVRRTGNELTAGLSSRLVFVLGASCGLAALLVHSLVDFNLQIPANAILAVALVALVNSHVRFATERYWIGVGPVLKGFLSIALLSVVTYLGWQEARRAQEYLCLRRAQYTYVFSPERAAALEKAFTAEPKNFETSYEIGEAYRVQSFEGGDNYEDLAKKAMGWYERSWQANPIDGSSYLRYGMCLDWIGRHEEAMGYFNRADELEPNSCFMAAHVGWHYVQVRNYAAARSWFFRSIWLLPANNDVAVSYHAVTRQRLRDGASTNDTFRAPW